MTESQSETLDVKGYINQVSTLENAGFFGKDIISVLLPTNDTLLSCCAFSTFVGSEIFRRIKQSKDINDLMDELIVWKHFPSIPKSAASVYPDLLAICFLC